jgi:hypothetical protein
LLVVVVVNTIKVHLFTMHMRLQQTMDKRQDVPLEGLPVLVVVVVITTVPQEVVVSIPTEEAVATEQEDYPS